MAFFESKHQHLKDDYSSEDGAYVDSCTIVAIDLAEILRSEGKAPRLLVLSVEKPSGFIGRVALIPLPFEGRVAWGRHAICVSDDIVYDPMLESPLPYDQYVQTSFGQVVEVEDRTDILDRNLKH
ncbi:MAG: hypothetical protein ACREF7_02470 [Candidatus Saccharimonadales bacterium]